MPHAFFASYARADNTKQWLSDVVDELTDRIQAKLGLGADMRDSIAFFDEDDIRGGADWEERLAEAVSEARVLICFASPTFFERPYCAKEFDVFRRRLEAADEGPRVILPVIWEPVGTMPAALSTYQYSHSRLPLRYREHGLRKLKAQSRRGIIGDTIDALAQDIVDMIREADPLPPLLPVPSFDELSGVFDNPGPSDPDISIVFVHPQGSQWRIDQFGPTVRDLLEHELKADRWTWRLMEPEAFLAGAGAEDGDTETDVVIVVDTRQASHEPALGVLAEVDAGHGGIHVIAGTPEHAAATPVDTPWTFSVDPPSPKQFQGQLQRLLADIRVNKARGSTSDRRITDDDTRREAAARGVDLSTQPSISGPGGP